MTATTRRTGKEAKGPKDGACVIKTKGLVKTFGNIKAVDGLDLEIRKGQLYGLLGPNGCGKTTTIRMVVGLLTITKGWAEVLGVRIPDKNILQRVGYMPQDTAVYREVTVHDNMELFGEVYEVPRDKIGKKEDELLELVELTDWKNALAGELSGGMMHRLSLACCLMNDPDVMFLDEPTVGVDPELRDTLWHRFQDMCAKGKTIVLTTHYIEEARHCDLVGLMRDGRIIAEDRPKALMERAGTDTLEDAFLHFTKGAKRTQRKAPLKDDDTDPEAGGGEEE